MIRRDIRHKPDWFDRTFCNFRSPCSRSGSYMAQTHTQAGACIVVSLYVCVYRSILYNIDHWILCVKTNVNNSMTLISERDSIHGSMISQQILPNFTPDFNRKINEMRPHIMFRRDFCAPATTIFDILVAVKQFGCREISSYWLWRVSDCMESIDFNIIFNGNMCTARGKERERERCWWWLMTMSMMLLHAAIAINEITFLRLLIYRSSALQSERNGIVFSNFKLFIEWVSVQHWLCVIVAERLFVMIRAWALDTKPTLLHITYAKVQRPFQIPASRRCVERSTNMRIWYHWVRRWRRLLSSILDCIITNRNNQNRSNALITPIRAEQPPLRTELKRIDCQSVRDWKKGMSMLRCETRAKRFRAFGSKNFGFYQDKSSYFRINWQCCQLHGILNYPQLSSKDCIVVYLLCSRIPMSDIRWIRPRFASV